VNIYSGLTSYTIPGPALFDGASSGNTTDAGTVSSVVSTPASSTAVLATSTASSVVVVASSSVSIAQAIQSTSSTVVVAASSVSSKQAAQTSFVIVATPTTTEVPAVATSDAAAPIISQIAGFGTAIPSGLLTSALPTAVPTGDSNYTGTLPTAALPEGITLKDLLEWVSYIMHNMLNKQNRGHKAQAQAQAERKHPRAF
jgi:cellulase